MFTLALYHSAVQQIVVAGSPVLVTDPLIFLFVFMAGAMIVGAARAMARLLKVFTELVKSIASTGLAIVLLASVFAMAVVSVF